MRERRQFVKFSFFKLAPEWRRLPEDVQAAGKEEFGKTLEGFRSRMILRTYSLVGVRGDCDFLLWQVAESIEVFQELATALLSTSLGAYLALPYSYLSMTRRSIYQIPAVGTPPSRLVQPSASKYLFVYPFVKSRAWYALPMDSRQAQMDEHIRIGRKYPGIRLNTTYSYGLDDQEFVLAFEGDDPADFLDLVMELRESEASSYTLRDTPTFTCIQTDLWDMLDSLGGAAARKVPDARRPDGFSEVAQVADVPPLSCRRVYVDGSVVALFNVAGQFYAIANRCTHARGSLSDGTVDAEALSVTCPWHDSRFDLRTGAALSPPARDPVPVYRIKVEGSSVLVAPCSLDDKVTG